MTRGFRDDGCVSLPSLFRAVIRGEVESVDHRRPRVDGHMLTRDLV